MGKQFLGSVTFDDSPTAREQKGEKLVEDTSCCRRQYPFGECHRRASAQSREIRSLDCCVVPEVNKAKKKNGTKAKVKLIRRG